MVDWANSPPGIQVLNYVRGEKSLKSCKARVTGDEVRVNVWTA